MKFNKLIPELSVTNIQRSSKFYAEILGFKMEYHRENFAFISFQGSQLMIEAHGNWKTGKLEHPFGRGINFQIEAKSIEPLLKSLKRHKYLLRMQPKDNWYRKGKMLIGNREFLVMDPDGYLLRFFEDLGTKRA